VKTVIAGLVVLLGIGWVTADGETEIDQLTQMEHRFAEAALKGDISSVEKMLAPEFVGVDPSGKELSRADVLANMRNPEWTIESLRHENVRVRLFGDCAVVLAITVVKGKRNGEVVAGTFPYMRVWVRREGRWLAVATQATVGGE
jgi:ketosteroid isomerase-like protein